MDILERPLPSRPLAAAFLGGTVGMGIEIIAARVVHPVYGSSIYVWGSILTVFMLALAVGYYSGGRQASTHASVSNLGQHLLQAAFLIAVVALVGPRVLEAATALPVPTRYKPLFPILLLFGPPSYVLGFISPYAAELAATDAGTGDAAGRTYAAGTLGSIVGAFSTTFFVVPYTSTLSAYIIFIGLLLVSGSILVGRSSRKGALTGLATVGVVALIVTAQMTGPTAVYETDTAYHHLEVRDTEDTRYLYLNGDQHSAIYTDDRTEYVFAYSTGMHLPAVYREAPPETIENVLVIGGGAGTLSNRYAEEYGANVDVVEIDPEVEHVAKTYFNASHPNVTWHVQDGRTFLRNSDATYDVVLLDAYQKDGVPYHLMTTEFMTLVRSKLTDDGIVAMNIISGFEGETSGLYRAELNTMTQTFTYVDSYPIRAETPENVQNIILVAGMDTPPETTQLEERYEQRPGSVPLGHLFAVRTPSSDVPTGDVPVFTDAKGSAQPFLEDLAGESYLAVHLNNSTSTAEK